MPCLVNNREFPAHFELLDNNALVEVAGELQGEKDLGWMLQDRRFCQ